MERRGVLRSWDDSKGFGFITPEQGGADVFAHISAMRGERRPLKGDAVMYVQGKDERGRSRAEHVRLADKLELDRPSIRRKPQTPQPRVSKAQGRAAKSERIQSVWIGNQRTKLLLLAALCFIPLLGAYQLFSVNGVIWALLAYPLASVISFVQYWHDKNSAKQGAWRTPEKSMHLVELAGGWPGALVAQQLFRHKTRKGSYQAIFWLIVIAHQLLWADWLLLDGRLFGQLLSNLIR